LKHHLLLYAGRSVVYISVHVCIERYHLLSFKVSHTGRILAFPTTTSQLTHISISLYNQERNAALRLTLLMTAL